MGMEYRPYYLAKEWVNSGHNVTIVAASFSHLRRVNPKMEKGVQEEFIDGIRYVWLNTPRYKGNGVSRIRNMLQFIWRLRYYVAEQLTNEVPDAVIASSTYPLDVYAAHKVQKQHNARFIFEVHDLWPLSPMELGNMSARHPYIMLMQKAENDAYRFCDAVVSLLPCAKEHMCQHGLDIQKFNYLPNGIDVTEWDKADAKLPEEHLRVLNRLKNDEQFIIGYAGSHGVSNALDVLVDAARGTLNEEIAYVFVGSGPGKEIMIQQAEEMALNNVYFLPSVEKSAIPMLLNMFDVCYIGGQKSPLYRFGVSPNKLMDYMMAAKPIIYAVETGNDPIKEAGCGITVLPEDPEAIAQAINQLANMTQDARDSMGQRGRAYVIKNHDYRVIARQFLKILGSEYGSEN